MSTGAPTAPTLGTIPGLGNTPDAETTGAKSDDVLRGEILDLVAKETGVDRAQFLPEASIVSLDIASLDMVQAIFALETHFGIEIPVISERSGNEFETVDDLVQHVIAAVRAGAG